MSELIKKLEVRQATELADFYKLPQSVVNMMFIVMGDTLYPKEHFLLYQGHKKGIQRIEVTRPQMAVDGEWSCEARIYPKVDARTLEALSKFSEKERKEMWLHLSEPTREWGRASKTNVRMSTMHEWLDAIAIKRAVCRALRLFAGVGTTAFEETQSVEVSEDEVKNARAITAAPA